MIATTNNIAGSNPTSVSHLPFVATRSAKPVRVWLTDDNAGFRELLEQLLTRASFNCELQFHSAEALLEGLANEPAPDVILLDVEMGGMTGVQALRPIRSLAPDVRVLIVTSFWDPMYEAQALRDGASTYLIKAHAPLNLVAEIHRALASPVKLAPLVPAASAQENAGSNPPLRKKGVVGRFGSWTAHLSSNLLRLAPTRESHA